MNRTQWMLVLFSCVVLLGCGRRQVPPVATKSSEVVVSLPVVKQVTDYEDFTGRTQAVKRVEVRARVSGYLEKVLFKEGYEVNQGDPLFEIDRRTYDAVLNQAQATMVQAQAHLARLELDFKRAAELLPLRSISREEYDKAVGDREEAIAAVKMAEAARDLAQLNLGFTTVTAPLTGRISNQMIDPGNMVKADETALTTIVAVDPVYAYFDVDERTMLRVRRMIRAGKIKSSQEAAMPVFASLVDEEGYPHEGTINFVDNRLDDMAGTLRLRGVFPNPNRILSAGLFVRVRLPIGKAHPAILVPDRALGSDQGQKFVYVTNDKNEVVYRRVKVGRTQDGMRVIEEGLAEGEWVIVEGLQRARPGSKVEPKVAETSPSPGEGQRAAEKPDTATSRPSS
jgi:RND family efflux transporter MFP subunit